MAEGDKQGTASRQSPAFDLLVVGGGIMGLWAAHYAASAGMTVHLLDEGVIGSGASGGLLGALMPHMPDRWSDKKQLQFDALVSLEAEIADLEARTGLSAGYRRTGRLIPLPKPHLNEIARGHERDALSNWKAGDRAFHWHVRDASFAGGLLAESAVSSGLVEDTLAGRVSPRGLTALLKASLQANARVTIAEHSCVEKLDPASGNAVLSDGSKLAFGHAIIAGGYRSHVLIEALAGPLEKPVVVPVKGQAALLAADLGADTPVVYLDGLYVVPHEGGRVAIGSTSENRFDEPFSTDLQLDALIAAAIGLVPALEGGDVLERWAGLRPKAIGRDPMVGQLEDVDRVSVLTGGFKVSFGIAHKLAFALMQTIVGEQSETGLPASFSPLSHLMQAGFSR